MNTTASCRSDQRLTMVSLLILLLMPVFVLAAPPHTPPGKTPPIEVFDYRDYRGLAVSHREFAVINGGQLIRVTDDMDRTEPGWLSVNRVFHFSEGLPLKRTMHFMVTDTEMLWHHEERVDSGGEVTTTYYNPPLSIRQSVMPKGAAQGGAAIKEVIGPSGLPSESGTTRINVALSEDDISVPAGIMSNCLRLYEEHDDRSRVSWYCPDYGFVKRIFSENGAIWEMDQCTGCPESE